MKSKYDNEIKAKVIDLALDKQLTKIKRNCYKQDKSYFISSETGLVLATFSDSWNQWKRDNINEENYEDYDCALRLNKSKANKVNKVREKVKELVETGRAVFITLTFTDDVLAKTSPLTRRRYVSRYLKAQNDVYVANIDFSPKEREHYHAIVGSRCNMSEWKYGFTFVEQIRNQDKDLKRTTNYVAKLTNHALKVNATRLIYSRDIL